MRLDHRSMSPDQILASLVDGTSSTPAQLAAAMSQFAKKAGRNKDPRVDLFVTKLVAAAPRFGPNQISTVFVACKSMVEQGQLMDPGSISSLLKAFCHAGVNKSSGFDAQGIANTLNSLGHLNVVKTAPELTALTFNLIEMLADEVPSQLSNFTEQGIANTVWGMATLGHSNPKVLEALLGAAQQKVGGFNEQDIANTLWAIACLNVKQHPTVQLLWTIVSKLDVSVWNDRELSQLFSVLSWFKLENSEWGMSLNPTLENAAAVAWARQHDSVKSSRLHKQVSKALTEMRIMHQNERNIGGQLVDIAVDQDQTVLEVDGPQHYCQNDTRVMLGNYGLKQRLLEVQGWRVVHIPFFEWDGLHTEQRVSYLKHKLAHGGRVF